MNIFILDTSPQKCAEFHADKHVGKMLLEGFQMLCTAHRVLDGMHSVDIVNGRKKQVWTLPYYDNLYYKAAHFGHPCTKWVMESKDNYFWTYQLCYYLAKEFVHRFGKQHKSDVDLMGILLEPPKNIPDIDKITPFALAIMNDPECSYPDDPVKSYRMYYQKKQSRMEMKWTHRNKPEWFTTI